MAVERYLRRCELKTARAVRGRLPAGRARGRRRDADGARRVRRAASASPSRCSTTCSTSPGPAERTGKHRGTDLLDGTVTLPFILARERDPELAALDPRAIRDAADGRGGLRPDRRDRRARRGPRARALELVAEAKAPLPADLPARQRAALELVADGVVERYA